MIAQQRVRSLLLTLFMMSCTLIQGQDSTNVSESNFKFIDFYTLRGTNTFATGIGSSVVNGDFEDPLFEIYFKAGYKRSFTPHFGASLTYHKFNLGFEDVFNNGFMSFDLNLEYLMAPHKHFSPYIFAGAGYNASNYFEESSTKVQVGAGIEYIVSDGVGLTLFADYNSLFDDELDGLVKGEANDTYFRMGFGLHFYFGGSKKLDKIKGDLKTVINSNLLTPRKSKVVK